MKNTLSLIYLFENSENLSFREKKLVCKGGPDIQQRIASAERENPDESAEAKLQRLQALSDFLSPDRSAKIEKQRAEAVLAGFDPELGDKGETKGHKFEDKDLNTLCGDFALSLSENLGLTLEKDLRTADLLISLDEAGLDAAKIKKALGKEYDSVRFEKKSGSSEVSIIVYKRVSPREQKVIGSFQVESETMREAVSKRKEFLEGYAKKRQALQEEITKERASQKKLRDNGKEYARTLQDNPELKDKYIIEFNSNKDLVWITIAKKEKPNELLVRIDAEFLKGKFKFAARNALPRTGKEFNRIAGENADNPIFPKLEETLKLLGETETSKKVLETVAEPLPTVPAPAEKPEESRAATEKAPDSGGWVEWSEGIPCEERLPPKAFKYKREGDQLIRYRLFTNGKDGVKKIFIDRFVSNQKWENFDRQLPEDFYKKNPTERPATESAEETRSPDATAAVTEQGIKKGIVTAEAARGPDQKVTFKVGTKKGKVPLVYTETGKRTAAGEQIVKYADSDEYYTDSGVRVTPEGAPYEGKGQKHSKVLGISVDITREKEKTLDEKTNAKVTLKKDVKLEKKDEKFIIDEIKTFKNNLNKLRITVEQNIDKGSKDQKYTTIASIAKLLEGIGADVNKELGKLVEKFEITSIKGIKLVWSSDGGLKNPENGDLRRTVYKILETHMNPQLFMALIERDKTAHGDEMLRGLVEKDRGDLLTGYIAKLDKKYSVEAIFQGKGSNFAYSQEKLRDEWTLLDGTTRVETILTGQFTTAAETSISQHEVPNIVAKILREASGTFKKEGTPYEVDFENLFAIVKPNISVFNTDKAKFLPILKNVTKDKDATFEKYLLDAKNLKKLLKDLSQNNSIEAVQLEEKILQAVIVPTVDLLESLSQLKKKDEKKEARTESAEGLIRDLMKDAPAKDFKLKEGNRFRLSEVSPFQNSKTLFIGVQDRLKADFIHQLILTTDVDNQTILQTIFRTVGIESLIRQECLAKNKEDEYMLVKLPEEYFGDKRKDAYEIATELITFKGNEKKYDKKMSDAEIMRSLDLIDKQSRIIKQVRKLCEAQDGRNLWSKFIGSIKGLGDFAYMSQLDGQTFFVDKSRMTREMTPEAAENYILYNNKYYKVDALKGVRTYNVGALQDDVNKFIALGALQKLLTDRNKDDKLPSPEDIKKAKDPATPEGKLFQERVAKLEVKDLLKENFTGDQIKAFQIGLLVDYNSQYEKQMNLPTNKKAREFFEKAIHTRASIRDIQAAYKTLAANADIKIDENGHITGFGIGAGVSIDTNGNLTGIGFGGRAALGGGFSLSAGVSLNTATGGGGVGLGLDYQIKCPDGSTFTIGVLFAASATGIGGGAVAAYTRDLYKGLLGTAMTGFFMDTSSPIPMVGAAFILSRDYYATAKIKTAEAIQEAGFETIAKAIDPGNREALLKAISEHPRYKGLLGFKAFGKITLTEDDIIAYVKMDYADLKAKGMTDASTSIFGTDWVPIARLGLGVPPSIMISIGTGVLASRPLLKKEAALLGIASALAVDEAVQLELTKPGEVEYVEDLADIYITKDGNIGYLVKDGRKTIDFSQLADKPRRDKALASINMGIEDKEGKRFLRIGDLTTDASSEGIAAEVHIDPMLAGELALHTTGSDIILEGDIQNLVITRERFVFPARTGKYGSSIRDVIYISKVRSALGNRNRLWANEHEETYLEKLPGYEWATEDGVNQRLKGASKTVFDVKGWQSLEASNPDLARQLIDARANEKEVTVEDVERKEKLAMEGKAQIDELHEADLLKAAKDRALQLELQKALEDKILRPTAEFKKDKKLTAIRADLLKAKENPERLTVILSSNSQTIFGRELKTEEVNIAVQYLVRGGFIDLPARTAQAINMKEDPLDFLKGLKKEDLESDPKKKELLIKYLNKGREILEKNTKYVAEAFKIEFETAIQRLKKRGANIRKLTSGNLVGDKMVADIMKKVPPVSDSTPVEDLLKHPLTALTIDPINAGATILYGTHMPGEKGKEVPAIARTFGSRETAQRTIREAGFLSNTATKYEIGSTNLEEKEMAMILLETASPLPEDNLAFLDSEFAAKIASLGALVFLMKSEDSYQKAMELVGLYRKDPGEIAIKIAKPGYREALADFRKVCAELREAQMTTGFKDIKYKDLTIRIHLSAATRSAAWSDCGNAGFESITFGNIEILKGNRVIVGSHTTLETLEPSVRKLYLEFGFGISVVSAPEALEEKPPKKEPGKQANEGTASGPVPGTVKVEHPGAGGTHGANE